MQPDWNKVKAIRLMKSGGWRTWLWRHRSTYFAAVHVLDGRFAESEVDVVAVGERTGEVGCCVQKQKTIVSIQTSLCAPLGCSKNPARVLEESLAGLWHIPPVIKNFLKILFRMFWCAYKRQPQPKTCRNGQIPPKWQFFMIIISIIAITNQEKKKQSLKWVYRWVWWRRTAPTGEDRAGSEGPFRRSRPPFQRTAAHLFHKKSSTKKKNNKSVTTSVTEWQFAYLPTNTDVLLCEGS